MTESDYRRGQDGAFDLVWEALGRAEGRLEDGQGNTDPITRAVLAVVRSELTAAVDAVQAEWECDERVERVRRATKADA